MAKAIDKTTILAIAVLTRTEPQLSPGGRKYTETIAEFTTEHWREVHAAVLAKLGAAGYVTQTGPERFGFADIHVRRTGDLNEPFIRVARTEPERSHHGGSIGANGYAVTGKAWGTGSRRYALDCTIDKQPTVWTYTFAMNWQKLLGAVEEELAVVEREHQWKTERARVDAVADRLRRELLPLVSRLALFSDAKKVIVETQQSTAVPPLFAVRVEFSPRHAVTSADMLPFLQRFPDAVPETVYMGVLLKSMTVDQIMAAVADLPVPA